MPSTLSARAEARARHLLDEDQGGLQRATWTAEVVEMLLDAEDLGVDRDVTLAAAWTAGCIFARHWPDTGDGYQVDDLRRDLGERVTRIVSSVQVPEWQDAEEHIRDLVGLGPVEAKIVALAQAMVEVVMAGSEVTEQQAQRVFRLAVSIPSLAGRAVAAGWPVPAVGEA